MASQNPISPAISEEKTILVKVLTSISEKCKTEGENQALMVPINEPENRITFYTGLSKSSISNILTNQQTMPALDLNGRIAVHDIVKCMYMREGKLNYPGLFKEASKQGLLKISFHINKAVSDLKEFIEAINSLGYEKRDSISHPGLVIENPEIRFERFMYLNRIKKIRETVTTNQLIYIDERIISIDQKFPKMWVANCKTEEDRNIFYHAVSRTGLVCGLYTNQASHEDFCKWVTDILLGTLKTPSIIILDNNPLHGARQATCPLTRYSSKKDILKWLTKQHIPCSSNMSKPALYELVQRFCNNSMDYYIDNIIRSHGHEVIRLPRYYYDLSITTPLWQFVANIKRYSKQSNQHPFELQSSLRNFIANIPLTTWMQFDKFVEQKERSILNTDIEIESSIDKYELKEKC